MSTFGGGNGNAGKRNRLFRPVDVHRQDSELRRRALELLRRGSVRGVDNPPTELDRLLHELNVHHAELVAQNEELQRAQQELERSRTRYRVLYDQAPIGYFTLDQRGIVKRVNLTGAGMLGVKRRNLVDRPMLPFIEPEHATRFFGHLARTLAGNRRERCDLLLVRRGGERFTARLECVTLRAGVNPPQCLCAVIDISELQSTVSRLRATAQRLDQAAHIDPLTRLLNRRGLEKRLAELGADEAGTGDLFAVLVDCDDFKQVNDELGHGGGDTVLQLIALRLRESLRPSDLVARMGGDEFLVVLTETASGDAARVGERIRAAVAESPMAIGPHRFRLSLSLGVARVPRGTTTIADILARTQSLLRTSKRQGKNRVTSAELTALHVGATTPPPTRARSREDDAPPRIDDIYAMGQPIVDPTRGAVLGYELLSRSTVAGREHPLIFFELARQSGSLAELDLQCARTALSGCARLPGGVLRFVNLFPSTMLGMSPDELLELLAGGGRPGEVCLEIAEEAHGGSMADVRERIAAVRAGGVRIALDGAGGGHTVGMLLDLEPDFVKIDRDRVMGIAEDAAKERALGRLVQMLRASGGAVIAEGVEERADLERLVHMGVPYVQGFLLGRPRPLEAICGAPARA